jgi:hypothetical protein
MGFIRLNDLSREIGIRSKHVLSYLSELKLAKDYSHSSSVDDALASQIRRHFQTDLANLPFPGRQSLINQGTIHPSTVADVPKIVRPFPSGPRKSYTSEVQMPPREEKAKKNPRLEVTSRDISSSSKPTKLVTEFLHKRSLNDRVKCKFCKRRFLISDMPAHLKFHLPARPVRFAPPKAHKEPVVKGPVARAPVPFATPPPITDPGATSLHRVPCKLCTLGIFPKDMDHHYKAFHTPVPKFPDIRSAKHSFIILPPGEVEYREIFGHYLKQSKSHRFLEHVIDWDRLLQIATLKPRMRHFGVESWFGYAVYEFTYSHRVVLECPLSGNATYILSGDWHSMIRLSKSDLRDRHADHVTRVFHTGDWLERISWALRRRSS